jgi:pilus assembly protein CpaE
VGLEDLEIGLLWGTNIRQLEIMPMLESIPGVKVTSQSSDPQGFIDQNQSSPPDVVLVEVSGENKIPLWMEKLVQGLPQTQILVCSDNREPDFILQVMHAGIRELLPLPLSETDLEAALNRIWMTRGRLKPVEKSKQGKILVVTGHKGGVGSTTIALNLAVALSDLAAERVALIDLGRPFPDVGHLLDQESRYSLADLMDNPSNFDKSFVQTIMQPYDTKLAILHGIPGFIDQEGLEEIFDRLFPILRDMYKYVVIDLSHWVDEFFVRVCTEADMVLILTQFTIPDIKNLGILFPMLREWQLEKRKIKIVVNRHISQHVVQLGDLDRIIQHPVFHTLPSDYFSLMKAIDRGTILANAAPRSKLWNSIHKLGTRILEEIDNQDHISQDGKQ